MECEKDLSDSVLQFKHANLTITIGIYILLDGKLSLSEALDLCRSLREFIVELFPGGENIFERLYAAKLRSIIHRVYD